MKHDDVTAYAELRFISSTEETLSIMWLRNQSNQTLLQGRSAKPCRKNPVLERLKPATPDTPPRHALIIDIKRKCQRKYELASIHRHSTSAHDST